MADLYISLTGDTIEIKLFNMGGQRIPKSVSVVDICC